MSPSAKIFSRAWASPIRPKGFGQRVVVRGAYTISSYLEGTGTNLRLTLNPPFNSEYQALYNTPDYLLPPTRLVDGLAGLNPKDPFAGATLRLWTHLCVRRFRISGASRPSISCPRATS